ncbi:MAG TPA: UbiA family prenyltransferase, partial [Agriterribacter sp.]|nr:UbiA family prenyltransferase [Agriterribacter sp.]
MTTVKNYLSLIKFSHTIFAMPFAMIGFFLAVRMVEPSLSVVLPNSFGDTAIYLSAKEVIVQLCLVVFCMILARSAAMAFNRYLDRHFDAKNPRTAIREIPAGIIKANSALW